MTRKLAPLVLVALGLAPVAVYGGHVQVPDEVRAAVASAAATSALEIAAYATAVEVETRVVEVVAKAWEEPVERVRAKVLGPPIGSVDSLSVRRGSGERWIVTLWVGDEVLRRFARAGLVVPVPVAARELERGHEVLSEDVATEERVRWGAPVTPDPSPVGMVTERVIAAGQPMRPPAVRPPVLVRGGEQVEVVLAQPGVVMRLQAEALSSGREGDRVSVRLPSGLRVDGRAVSPGLVELMSGGSR